MIPSSSPIVTIAPTAAATTETSLVPQTDSSPVPSVAEESSNMVAQPSTTIISEFSPVASSSVPEETYPTPEPSSFTEEFSELVPEIATITDVPSIMDGPLPIQTTVADITTSSSSSTSTDFSPTASIPPPAAIADDEPEVEAQPINVCFKVNGRYFHVINKFESSAVAAGVTCNQIQASIATVTSDSYQGVVAKLKDVMPGKVIIGAWNGDNYSLTGSDCLILQANHGIFPGTCTDASAILCQS